MKTAILGSVLLLSIPFAALAAESDLYGTWKLVSLNSKVIDTGEMRQPRGKAPNGYVSFTPDGRVTGVIASEKIFATLRRSSAAALPGRLRRWTSLSLIRKSWCRRIACLTPVCPTRAIAPTSLRTCYRFLSSGRGTFCFVHRSRLELFRSNCKGGISHEDCDTR